MCITSRNKPFTELSRIILSMPFIISKELTFSLWTPCRSGVTSTLILNLGFRWKWVVRFTPAAALPQSRQPTNWAEGCLTLDPFRTLWREEKSLGTVWNRKKIPHFSKSGPVTTPTQPPNLCRWETKRTKVFHTDKYRIQITNTMAVHGRLAGAV